MYRWLAMLLVASLLVLMAGPGIVTSVAAIQEAAEKQDEDKEVKDKDQEAEKEVDPAVEAFENLQKEMQTASREFMKKVREAPRDEQMKLYMSGGPNKDFAKKFLAYAKEHAGSKHEFDAISYAAQMGDDEVSKAGLEIIADKFADDDGVKRMLRSFSRSVQFPEQKHEDFLNTLADKSTIDEIKGGAKFTLFQLWQQLPDMQDAISSRPEMADVIPKASQEYINKDRGEAFSADLEKMLEDIAKNFAEVKYGRSTLGKMAGDELFVYKYLTVGKEAPEIDGIDLDGEAFKLSDYRGKVVLLDFWGDW